MGKTWMMHSSTSSSWPFYVQKHCSLPFKPFSQLVLQLLLCQKHWLPVLRARNQPTALKPLCDLSHLSGFSHCFQLWAASFWRNDEGQKPTVLQLWETCCFGAWKPPGPVNTGRPLSQPWKCRGGVQCKLMETFMKANKDKAWQENGCRALFYFLQCEARPVARSTSLILLQLLTTLNLKNIQGIYSYTRSASYKSVNCLVKK